MSIQLYDHEIEAIDRGPVKWMTQKQGTRMDMESFRRGTIEQFEAIGLKVDVKVWTTSEDGTFAFDIDFVDRMTPHEFDYDRQVHEVVNNYLNDPDAETGFIKAEFPKSEHKH